MILNILPSVNNQINESFHIYRYLWCLISNNEEKMCLGIPAKVVAIDDKKQGKIDYLGTKVKTNFALLENVKPGDWVIVHAGFAISRLNEQEAKETLELIREYSKFTDQNNS